MRPHELDAWIQTSKGRKFYPLHPNPEELDIDDIAHALSNLCRFAGHTRQFYSVAQHSVLVSHHCKPEHALWGLLHDASEAYLLDLPRPLKNHWMFKNYRDCERALESVIWFKFGLVSGGQNDLPADVKDADLRVWAAECRDLMSPLHPDFVVRSQPIPERIEPLLPLEAKALFIDRWLALQDAAAQQAPRD